MSDNLRQCDACGIPQPGNLSPPSHPCGHGNPCKPHNTPGACHTCVLDKAALGLRSMGYAVDSVDLARMLGNPGYHL